MTVAPCTEIVLDSRFEETRKLGPWLVAALGEVGSEGAVDDLELALVELVTNIVMHAGTPAHLTVHLEEGTLGVLVRDGGQAVAEAVPASDEDPLRVSGRGLTLIDALADRWGTHSDAYGTIAWFVLLLGVSDDAEETG